MYWETHFLGHCPVSFVERFLILCPYLGGSTIGGSTVLFFMYDYLYNNNCNLSSLVHNRLNWGYP